LNHEKRNNRLYILAEKENSPGFPESKQSHGDTREIDDPAGIPCPDVLPLENCGQYRRLGPGTKHLDHSPL
jgi:hypothetical protein